jgi:hypothetical protein
MHIYFSLSFFLSFLCLRLSFFLTIGVKKSATKLLVPSTIFCPDGTLCASNFANRSIYIVGASVQQENENAIFISVPSIQCGALTPIWMII